MNQVLTRKWDCHGATLPATMTTLAAATMIISLTFSRQRIPTVPMTAVLAMWQVLPQQQRQTGGHLLDSRLDLQASSLTLSTLHNHLVLHDAEVPMQYCNFEARFMYLVDRSPTCGRMEICKGARAVTHAYTDWP